MNNNLLTITGKKETAWKFCQSKPGFGHADVLQFNADWNRKYKNLVAHTYKEAVQKLETEQQQKAYAKQIQAVIQMGKENSDWVEQLGKKDLQQLKREEEIQRLKEQAKNNEKERER